MYNVLNEWILPEGAPTGKPPGNISLIRPFSAPVYLHARAIQHLLSTLDARAHFGHLMGWEAETNYIVYVPNFNLVVITSYAEFSDWAFINALTRLPIGGNSILPKSRSFPPLLRLKLKEDEVAKFLPSNEDFSNDERFHLLNENSAGLDGPIGVSADAPLGDRSRVPPADLAHSDHPQKSIRGALRPS